MLYIGVDLGTSAVKLLLMDGEGTDKKDCFKRVPAVFSTAGLVGTAAGRLVYPDDGGHPGTTLGHR